MPERPILFSGSMIRAIIEGKKTMTRRVIKSDPDLLRINGRYLQYRQTPEYDWFDWLPSFGFGPHGATKDTLYVREAFARNVITNAVFYKADSGFDYLRSAFPEHLIWKPGIHMPKALARLRLEIKSVKVERINQISAEDALAEGVTWWRRELTHKQIEKYDRERLLVDPVYTFEQMWNTINAKRGYPFSAGHWCWCYTFKRLR